MIRVPKDARCGPRVCATNTARTSFDVPAVNAWDRRLLAELRADVIPGEHG